jgi:hypothetical protein
MTNHPANQYYWDFIAFKEKNKNKNPLKNQRKYLYYLKKNQMD